MEPVDYSLRYQFKYKDTPIFDLEYTNSGFQISYVYLLNSPLQPLGLRGVDINAWLRLRTAPYHRGYLSSLLGTNYTLKDYVDLTKALSLQDNYWIVPYKSKLLYSDYSLFLNNFNSVVSDASLGISTLTTAIPHVSSPELSTDGVLPKAWRRVGNNIYLYKRGSPYDAGLQPYSEVWVSQIAEVLGFNHLSYWLEDYKGYLCSVCKCFTSLEESFVPFGLLVSSLEMLPLEVYKWFQKNISWLAEEYIKLQILVYLVRNYDCHLFNFGFLTKNNRISSFISYDYGAAFFSDRSDYELIGNGSLFDDDFSVFDSDLAVLPFIRGKYKEDIKRLIGFTLSPLAGVSRERVDYLNQFLSYRVSQLLKF